MGTRDLLSFGIRGKLIAIFVVIKVIPLLILAWIAWHGHQMLADRLLVSTGELADSMRGTVALVGEAMTADSIKALDVTSREALERLTTDTARSVAAFLYDRDADILVAADLPVDEQSYRRFLAGRVRDVVEHDAWVPSEDGAQWQPATQSPAAGPDVHPSAKDNERDFHYRQPEHLGRSVHKPLFLEMTFVDASGRERIKITSSDVMPKDLRDVSQRENTWVKAETYWPEIQNMKPGDIWVSDVIGAYVGTKIIGTYSPAAAAKKGIAFQPEESAYAGMENPVGKRFQGIVRWVTPVVRDGKTLGWVTLALDQTHLAQLVDPIRPSETRYSAITDPGSGNYAFIWDYKGRSIVHPRHYFIVGYDPETGDPVAPWLEDSLYTEWKASGLSLAKYLETAPTFRDQSLARKPAMAQVKEGTVALDCRYLNFAPQCTGWMDLTQHGGSGSFAIFWSGLWKLTTAAAIPYHTGPYAKSPRGFGFVAIGANVDDFHRAATEAKERIDKVVADRDAELTGRRNDVYHMITGQVANMTRDLSVSTALMLVFVIGVAIWMASALTRRITVMIDGIRQFEAGRLDYRLETVSGDEMGQLAGSFNAMADAVEESIKRMDEARRRAEEVSRLKSEFLANVSHELRTPLNGILGFAELLKEDAETDENRESAEFILDSGRHLLDVVNSILDIAKIEAGRMALIVAPLDLHQLVAGVAGIHQRAAADKGLEFALTIDAGVPLTVAADGTRLRQVLHNLLSNAVKFTAKGSVSFSVTAADGVSFTVRDTGPGIPLEEQAQIFEKFHQAEKFNTRTHGGAGLGLALVRHLVQLMGGDVSLVSVPGEGAEFKVVLPLKAVGAQPAAIGEPIP